VEHSRSAAFAEVVLSEDTRVSALAFRLAGNQDDAEDLAQESLLRAWKYFSGFGEGAVWPWLRAIVFNTWSTWRSRRRPQCQTAVRAPSFDQQLLRAIAVREAVAELPGELRLPVLYHALGGLTGEEIACRLGLSRKTVYQRVRRARLELRKALAGFR